MIALVIVDAQNDFLTGGSLPVENGGAIIPVINRIVDNYPLIAATQDWHPVGHASFASSHPGRKPFERIQIGGREQTLWPDHCVWGTPGARFPQALNLDQVAAIFRKGMDPDVDSYSGFFDNERRHKTGLAEWLRAMGVDAVHIAGLAAEVCVACTARDARELGFRVAILEDATMPLDRAAFDDVARELRNAGIVIGPAAELSAEAVAS